MGARNKSRAKNTRTALLLKIAEWTINAALIIKYNIKDGYIYCPPPQD
jgi:hypothetical protein